MAGKPKKPRPFHNKGFIEEDVLPLSFDTETRGLGGELLCITACDFSEDHFFEGETMVGDFFTLMLNFPYPFVWYAHNAQYDWRYFLGYIRANSIPCDISMRNETDIYQIKLIFEGKKIVMRDSLAIFPGTLREFARSFTPELPKGDIDFEAGAEFDLSNPEHRAYAMRDAKILRVGLPRLNAMLQRHFGVGMGHTTAGTALKAWMASLADSEYYEPSTYGEEEDFIRSAYYGGLVFLTRTDPVKQAQTYDINSSYPDKMCRYGVPYGQRMRSTDWRDPRPGIFRVRVRTPGDLIVPILPRRDAKGYMAWSRGTFETTVTNRELVFAEAHGYVIEEVFDGIAWEETVFPFNRVVDKCKGIRKSHKGKPEETLAKLIQNSLYGKFGSRRERLRVVCSEGMEDDELLELEALPLDDAGYWLVCKEFSEDLRCLPHWAVFITAHARLHLLETIHRVGVENVIYGDTDSLTVLPGVAHLFDVGDDYGQWKLEKTWRVFRADAPKVYAGLKITPDGDVPHGAAKGLPRKGMTPALWRALLDGERICIPYLSLPALRVAMAKGVRPAQPVQRVNTNLKNSANWELQGSRVRPKLAASREAS